MLGGDGDDRVVGGGRDVLFRWRDRRRRARRRHRRRYPRRRPGQERYVFQPGDAPLTAGDRIVGFNIGGDDVLDLGPAGTDANYREAQTTASTMEQALQLANAQLGGRVIYAAMACDGPGAEDGVLIFWDTNADATATT